MSTDRTAELLDALSHGWNVLRLAAEVPDRVPTWDAVVLTAAGEKQAALYTRRLEEVRRRGLVAGPTRLLVVPDPGGRRVGSGGATLNALRLLERSLPGGVGRAKRVLLIHAGGDSRRLPWTGVFGKPFVPFPLLCDPDRELPTLLDQILAMAAPVALNLPQGGLLTLTGDVLPIWRSGRRSFPADTAVVLAKPMSLDVASRHGVILPGRDGTVKTVLQKPAPREVVAAGGVVVGGAALVDTGVVAFTGAAFEALTALACAVPDPMDCLVREGVELSLYEEIVGAMVTHPPACLDSCPLAKQLVAAFRGIFLRYQAVPELEFLHFGTSAELLEHLRADWHGQLPARVLAHFGEGVSPEVFAYRVQAAAAARVGSGTLLLDARLGPGVCIGDRCIVVNADLDDNRLIVPSHRCIWQLPVRTPKGMTHGTVTACCGVDDNPKEDAVTGTFCNRDLTGWMETHGVVPDDLWRPGEPRTVWTARFFPVHERADDLRLVQWMLDDPEAGPSPSLLEAWRSVERLSLAELPAAVDADRLTADRDRRCSVLLTEAVSRAVAGRVDRDILALALQVAPGPGPRGRFAELAAELERETPPSGVLASSRLYQMRADLAAAAGESDRAARLAARALEAVQVEVAAAIRSAFGAPVRDLPSGQRVDLRFPVRFDLAGGWSDTPPYCLERPAGVLNFALNLDGHPPVAVEVEALDTRVWDLTLADSGAHVVIPDAPAATRTGDLTDPFCLLRTALLVTGYGTAAGIGQGVRIVSGARVPCGSGLGTSSILGAALVTALQRLAGRADDWDTVSERVLSLEQLMTTGGGWQDQVGGLVPGLKLVSSVPVRPLRLKIERVPLPDAVREEFEQRFVVAFSGQERLAKDVLQKIVRRYLRRDRRLVRTVEALVHLAYGARTALAVGDLDALGRVLREVWALHQQLDPHCSNPAVDALFREIDDLASGFKLAGAGGGGFLGVLAKDAAAAGIIRDRLNAMGRGVRVYSWRLADGGGETGGRT
ncbi:MAG: hypothetical protein GXP31_01805 [Kiritimatiellaeota bacterium]|nr:hypothetical protein [Kiritimatiellota bacterium]